MKIAQNISIFIVAVAHIYFFYLERFLWRTPEGQRKFKMSPEDAKTCEVLAANQGVYNLLLGIGLLYYLICPNTSIHVVFYILAFIIVAGIYGAITVGKSILFLQVIPAAIALILSIFSI